MIHLQNISKSFRIAGRRQVVIDDLTLSLQSGAALALLGRNGAGKSVLMQMIAGLMRPDRGTITSDGSISWPVGFAGAFHPQLTGAQNTRFVARIHGVETEALCAFAEAFTELGAQFHMPVRSYSTGMRARLAFALSMGIDFDTYLVDEVTAAGDARFREKSRAVFADRMRRSGAIMVNHNLPDLRRFCSSGLVLDRGRVTYYADLDEAIAVHRAALAGA